LDARTDARLQQLMREVCASATVLTIAHRLQTVMEADWLVVMGGGRIVETGRPGELAADPLSRLSSLLAS
jgi:ATP-binding cassette subfamily B protein